MTMYAAIVAPILALLPLVLGVLMLTSKVEAITIILFCCMVFCSVVIGIYIVSVSNQLYSWGFFQENGVYVKTLFSKPYLVEYERCSEIGIDYYIHGVFNSEAGSKIFFIYFSNESLPTEYRGHINLWKPSKYRIKVKFDKKLYNYLLTVLPNKRVLKLQFDFKRNNMGSSAHEHR